MKSRIIVAILSLLTVLSAGSGAYFYYSLNQSISQEAAKLAVFNTDTLKNQVSFFLMENMKTVKTMAGLKELPQSLTNLDDTNALAEANRVLDHFQGSLGVEVCYLIDKQGKTVASSNRNTVDSFVGGNYAVRPYFQEAMQGNPSVYMALGLTSKKPGAYYGHPVYVAGQRSPIGVAVIKSSVETVTEFFRQSPEEIMMLTDPHGLVFMASREAFCYRMLWQTNQDQIAQIEKTKQFGQGPFTWSGMELKEGNRVVSSTGDQYLLYQTDVESYPGWRIVNLRPVRRS